MILFTYCVFFFLVLRFSVTLFNFISNPKLPLIRPAITDLTSVVITVRNGESNLLNLLESLMAQEYKNLEVIIYHSGLDSADIKLVEEVCQKDIRFRLKKGIIRDYNWVSKETKGDYLLFLDSNMVIEHGFINSLVYRLKVFKIAVLSIIPNLVFESFFQRLVLPLNDFVMLNLVPLRLVKLIRSPVLSLASNTNCVFMDGTLYREREWEKRVDASKGLADLIKVGKQDGLRAEVLLGNKLVYQVSKLKQKDLLKSAAESVCLNFGNLLIEMIYLLLVVCGPLIVFLGIDFYIVILPIGLIFLSRLMLSFLTGQNPALNILLHPLQMLMMFFVFMKAFQMQLLTALKHKRR